MVKAHPFLAKAECRHKEIRRHGATQAPQDGARYRSCRKGNQSNGTKRCTVEHKGNLD
jgi:hypothetical protein